MMLVRQIIPSRAASARDLPALETAMQALALDEQSPLALEIAVSATTRQFLGRAESPLALHYLEKQLQARYPQARIAPLEHDPLVQGPAEECSAVELRPGAASFLPLRSWKPREWLAEGTDPLLGILAACGALPGEARAVLHLALLPARPAWSANSRRYALEHPLARERTPARQNRAGHSLRDVLLLVPVVSVLLAVYAWHGLLPAWLLRAGQAMLTGQSPHLSAGQQATLWLGAIVGLLVLVAAIFLLVWLQGRLGGRQLYDPRLAEEKTARPAYRARIRLYVFTPGEAAPEEEPQEHKEDEAGSRWVSWKAVLRGWHERLRAPLDLAALWHRQHQRRLARKQARARRAERARLLRLLVAPYRQYHLASGGYFLVQRLSSRQVRRLLAPVAGYWFWRTGWSADVRHSLHLLSVADLAALWHLPQAQDLAELPFVEPVRLRTLPVPTVLSSVQGYPLGSSTHAGQQCPVLLPFACLRQNLLAAAATGKGKSTLFAHLLCALAQARLSGVLNGGALLVDPHGDLVDQVAGLLPEALADEVVVVRLADRSFPPGFNPLDMALAPDRDKLIDNLIGVVEALWPTSYGPRTESFVEYGCKTLAEANATLIARDPIQGPDQQFTLLDLVPLFRATSFRHAVLELVDDQHLKNWWEHYFEQLDGRQQAEFTSSLVTKVAKFASSRISRRILGQPRSSLDLADLIQQERLVLLSCDAGVVGADLAALFGSLFVGFFQTALAEQARLEAQVRHPMLVLIDEFQMLAGINYQTMLAELRKYGGSFGLATQSLAYLDRFERTLRATVLANVDHLFAFAMADEDARLLHLPGVEPEDVIQLPNYTCYTRLTLDGERLPVFALRLSPLASSDVAQRDMLLARSRARYGRAVGLVDQVLRECEARQRSMKPSTKRIGRQGVAVTWTGTGEERVDEVLDADARRQRPRGRGGKNAARIPLARHTLYQQPEENVSPGEENATDPEEFADG